MYSGYFGISAKFFSIANSYGCTFIFYESRTERIWLDFLLLLWLVFDAYFRYGGGKTAVKCLGMLSFVSSFFLFAMYARRLGYAPNEIYDNISLTVLYETSMIFLLFKENIRKEFSEMLARRISLMSKWTFGVYMIHMLVLWELDKFLGTYNTAPIIEIPLMVILTFLISLVIVIEIDKIPKLRKYII